MTALTEPLPSALPASPAPPRVWGFWGTGAWTIAAIAVWAIAQIGAVAVLLAWQHDIDLDTFDVSKLDVATVVVIATFASAPLQIAVIAAAVRLARTPFRDYVALYGFTRRDFALGFVCLLALGLIYDGGIYLLGRDIIPPVMVQMYVSARDSGLMVPFVLAIGVLAPVAEEIIFRGFIYRGWAGSWLGVAGTVLVTAGLWAIMHTQYDWDAILLIFGIGLLFGWLRWRSGSTSLTIALHVLINLGATVQTAIKVEYFS
jgi:membrane protease YdiL (CAAX protease family)